MSSKAKNGNCASNIIVHNSSGLKFADGPPNFGGNSSNFQDVVAKLKYLTISQNGKKIAWISDGVVSVVEAPHWKKIGSLQHPKAVEICFSPNGNFLGVWDIYSQAKGAPPPTNLTIYDVNEKKLLKAFTQKSHEAWQPQWTKDESVMARMTPSEVHFYEGADLESFKHKKVYQKMKSYSLAPSTTHHHVVFFVPSLKGAPAFVHLYKYPNLKDNTNIVSSKSFFKVDTIEYFWNPQSTAVLLLTTAEVDRSGGSYYGQQALYFLNTRGDSNRVTFSKEGNIRCLSWCPSGKEFFCVYGSSPAKATIFNLKCDPVAEFGDGARNLVLVNPQGNLVLIGGMGNISSRFEIWDVKERKQLAKQEYPDITQMEWSPCGQHIITSTCSPRLRVNNGFRVWHYSTSLLYESLCEEPEELYSATWLPDPSLAVPFDVSNKRVQGIESQVKKASNQRYIPPSQRAAAAMLDRTKKFLSQREVANPAEDAKKAENEKKRQQKREKRAEEKKKKKEEMKGMDKNWREKKEEEEKEKEKETPVKKTENSAKRVRNLKKKLEAIEKLKEDKAEGKPLNNDQLQKIESEQSIVKEIEELSLT